MILLCIPMLKLCLFMCQLVALFLRRRTDTVESLDVEHIFEYGAGKCILIERALFEIAYKLGLSAKYGA